VTYQDLKKDEKPYPQNHTGLLKGRCSADDSVSDHLNSISKEIL